MIVCEEHLEVTLCFTATKKLSAAAPSLEYGSNLSDDRVVGLSKNLLQTTQTYNPLKTNKHTEEYLPVVFTAILSLL